MERQEKSVSGGASSVSSIEISGFGRRRAMGGSSPIDATQGPSRVSRIDKESGKEYGIVYDFTDEFDDQFYKHAMARRRIYKKHDWTQVEPAGAFSQGISRMFFS
jgi:hypothetical protein